MTTAVLQRDALMPRPPDGMGPGLMLALLIHLLLVAALALSVRWHASEPEGVEAELWAAVPQIAAPKAVEPEPTPVKPPKPEPPAPPQPAKTEPAPDAQIAIEKAKREKEAQEKKEQAEKLAEKQRLEQEAKRKELEDKRKKQLEEQRLAALHEQNVKRMLGQAGATGEPTSTGTAARTSGPSASYLGRVIARIKPHVQFPLSQQGEPAEVTITTAPDGTILTFRLAKSSGSSAFDEAALRAVQETAVLPRDTDGRVPSPMTIIIHRPGT
ncbi:MAG TPA: cell envelope integrity protein TolA [Albitalea sp.]|nr:cell envelope integrity protein TolA [Albitalea sp.]